jgi:SSS family solute:Na+ symporter
MKKTQHKLSALQVAVALATTHYGLGFLVGTGQDIAQYGAAGMLYAFSTAVGLLTLIPIASFYWKKRKPIWDIFELMHGKASSKITAFLSSFWMIGVIASQILGGSAALMAFGMPRWISTMVIAGLILVLSYLDLGKLSKVFFYFLVFSSLLIALSLFKYGMGQILWSPANFLSSLPSIPLEKLLGVSVTTILITFIGMDFHQFIVESANSNTAKKGAFGGFVFLALLTFVLGTSIMGYINYVQYEAGSALAAAQIVPRMLMDTGSSLVGDWSQLLFLLPIIFVSAGSGSAVTKVIMRASHDLLPKTEGMKSLNFYVVLCAVVLTMLSQSVVGLVVSFYATYVGAVFIPFIVVLLEERGLIKVKDNIFLNAIILGFILSLFTILTNKLGFVKSSEISIYMLIAGFAGSIAVFATAKPAQYIASKMKRAER